MAFIVDSHLLAGFPQQELQNWGLQKLAADPGSPFVGQFYINTGTGKLRIYNGTTWDEYGTGASPSGLTQSAVSTAANKLKVSAAADRTVQDYAGADGLIKVASGVVSTATAGTDYVTAASSNTFTNKTFDANGTGNSISNLETADFAAGVLNTSGTLAGATATQIPSALAVSQAISSAVSTVAKPMGGIDCSANPNYPAANVGEFYRITVAGKIGGAAGIDVQVGDQIHCYVTSASGTQATVGANWTVVQANVDQATTTTLGLTRYATSAETEAKTLTNVAVTPADLVKFGKMFTQAFGDGAATSFTITHNLNNVGAQPMVRETATGLRRYPTLTNATANTVTVSGYVSPPTASQFTIDIIG